MRLIFVLSTEIDFFYSPQFKNAKLLLNFSKHIIFFSIAISFLFEYNVAFANDTTEVDQILTLAEKKSYEDSSARLDLLHEALLLSRNLDDKKRTCRVYQLIAETYSENAVYWTALDYYKEALQIALEADDERKQASLLENIGLMYDYLGDYSNSMDYSLQSLELFEKLKDTTSIAYGLNNIGVLYYYQENFEMATEYYENSLKLANHVGDKWLISTCYNNIANIYSDNGDNHTALKYYFKSVKMDIEMNDLEGEALTYGNIGETYLVLKNYRNAEFYLNKAFQIYKKLDDEWGMSNQLSALSDLESKRKHYLKAVEYLKQAEGICKKQNLRSELEEVYERLSNVLYDMGDFKESVEYLRKHKAINDSLYNEKNLATILELEQRYQKEKREKEINELKQTKKLDLLRIQQQRNEIQERKIQRNFLIGIAVLFILLIVALLAYQRTRNKAGKKLSIAYKKIADRNKDIRNSLEYARKIQYAILPPHETIDSYLEENFIFYQPKEVVSGDFYWFFQHEAHIFIATVDCTGHGVPGAFVSMVGNNKLNAVIGQNPDKNPAEILDLLNVEVKEALHITEQSEVKDGMDLSICKINFEKGMLEYAGANNPLYMVKKGDQQISQVKANKQSIGTATTTFTNFEYQYKSGDCFYLFTDGFADQFGGPKGKKFNYKRFRKFLLRISSQSMIDQAVEVKNTFNDWKGNEEQVDDVCVIGFRL